MKARDQINNEVKAEMARHHRTGITESSIKDAPIEWDGLVAKIPIGFDINDGGFPSIFLIYGTPKQKPDNALRRLLDKRKGYLNEVLNKNMEDEYNKMMRSI